MSESKPELYSLIGLAKISSDWKITIPKDVRTNLELKEEDHVLFYLAKGEKSAIAKFFCMQKYDEMLEP